MSPLHRSARAALSALVVAAMAAGTAPAMADAVVGERPGPPPVRTTTQDLPLRGVDRDALDDLLEQATKAPARVAESGSTLLAEPAAVRPPAVLTEEMIVEPFTLAAVTWGGRTIDVTVDVRLRESGEWSAWQRLEAETAGSHETSGLGAVGTEPLVTGGADGVQVRVDTPDGAAPSGLSLVLVDGGEATDTSLVLDGAAASSRPTIVTRAQWGADESLRNGTPGMSSSVQAITVHHTAGTNNYSASNAAAQVRAVYAYHTNTLGWADIGYNFLVDKFGTIYEGRAGSIDKAVQGAHAGGFNSNTMGVSALGNYDIASAPSGMVDALGRVTGWKLSQYGVDPGGTVQLTSAGGGTSKYAQGTTVTLPRVFPHKQVGSTACPGRYLDGKMSTIRSVAKTVAAAAAAPAPAPTPTPIGGDGATPVAADIDGDGKEDLGWFRAGRWAFKTATGVVRLSFGTKGDLPVTGDWDDDGKDGIGIYRSGWWHLRNTATTGAAQQVFSFGRAGDRPVTGHWAGQGRDGIGVVRGNTWYARWTPSSGPHHHSFRFGRDTDVPLLGSWLDDGIARPGVVRGITWYLSTSIKRPAAAHTFVFGRSGDRWIVTDPDGDGMQTATAVRGTTFYVRSGHGTSASVLAVEFAG